MESFWERIFDISVLVIKAFVMFLAIRVFMVFIDYRVSVPILDPILYFVLDKISLLIPGLQFNRF